MPHRLARFASTLVVATAVLALGVGCRASSEVARQDFTPLREGFLTVATDLPAPGFWQGATPREVDGGYEWAIADAMAERLDLELRIVDVDFADIIERKSDGYDLALAQISITPERSDLTFSDAYYVTSSGVVTRADRDPITDLATAQDLRWAAESDSTHLQFVQDVVDPDDDVVEVPNGIAAIDLVDDGTVDAALLDLATALILTAADDAVTTNARFATDERIGVVVEGDPDRRDENLAVVNAAIRSLTNSGRTSEFDDEWLRPLFESDPSTLPAIRYRD